MNPRSTDCEADALITTPKIVTILGKKIWETCEWPIDWKRSIYISLPKKEDIKKCSNHRTIALISHASKVLPKIIQKKVQHYVEFELPQEQAEFCKGRGTRDHIANLRWIMEKAREMQKVIFMCFIDYSKAFDCVEHNLLQKKLQEVGLPRHLIKLMNNLYTNQEATMRTEFGNTSWFKIRKGVIQGCITSPYPFNLYMESIMRKSGIEAIQEIQKEEE